MKFNKENIKNFIQAVHGELPKENLPKEFQNIDPKSLIYGEKIFPPSSRHGSAGKIVQLYVEEVPLIIFGSANESHPDIFGCFAFDHKIYFGKELVPKEIFKEYDDSGKVDLLLKGENYEIVGGGFFNYSKPIIKLSSFSEKLKLGVNEKHCNDAKELYSPLVEILIE